MYTKLKEKLKKKIGYLGHLDLDWYFEIDLVNTKNDDL